MISSKLWNRSGPMATFRWACRALRRGLDVKRGALFVVSSSSGCVVVSRAGAGMSRVRPRTNSSLPIVLLVRGSTRIAAGPYLNDCDAKGTQRVVHDQR